MFEISNGTDINELVHGGQLYRAFLFSKGSLLWALPSPKVFTYIGFILQGEY
jgi:hypothetical protein